MVRRHRLRASLATPTCTLDERGPAPRPAQPATPAKPIQHCPRSRERNTRPSAPAAKMLPPAAQQTKNEQEEVKEIKVETGCPDRRVCGTQPVHDARSIVEHETGED